MHVISKTMLVITFWIAGISVAKSDLLVPHALICKNNIVQKLELYKVLVAMQPISENVKLSVYPNWRTILTSKNFCSTSPACQKGDAEAIENIKVSFIAFLVSGSETGSYIPTNTEVTMEQYFVGPDSLNGIKCGSIDIPAPVKSSVDNSPVRIRGSSDDLYIDRSWPEFKGTSQGAVNYTNDKSSVHTTTTSIKAAIGYAFQIDDPSKYLASFIPYVSANESVTNTKGKARTLPASNNFAAGFALNADIGGKAMFTIKPQFVDGTAMHSQLTMLQAIYTPWTNKSDSGQFMPFNTVVPVYGTGNDSKDIWGQFLFDLRADLGAYSDRGDPMYVAKNANFARFGSKFGFAFFTAPGAVPVTLRATEVLMYGAEGFQRNISYFDSSLSFGLDRNGYASLTFSYTNGHDENTTIRAQIFKAGLAARY
jgi:hypothetical protein